MNEEMNKKLRQIVSDSIVKLNANKKFKMDPTKLVSDLVVITQTFVEEQWEIVIDKIIVAINDLLEGKVNGETLKYDLIGKYSYHFESGFPTEINQEEVERRKNLPANKVRYLELADRENLRIVYRVEGGSIIFESFGHRFKPDDFYVRLKAYLKSLETKQGQNPD